MAHEAKVWVSHWPAAGGRFNGNWAGVSLAFCAVPGTQWGGGLELPLNPDPQIGSVGRFREGRGYSQPAGKRACS